MPNIPRFETKDTVPNAPEFKATPNIAMGKAMEEGGKAIATAGNQLLDYERYATNAEKVLQYTEAKQNFAADIDNLKASFAERTDYDNFESDYNKAAQEIHQKHLSSVTYPDVQKKVAPYLDLNLQRGLIAVKAHGRQLRSATLEAKADTQIDGLLKDYAFLKRSGDPDAELKMSEAEMVISEMATTGAYSPAKAEKLRRDIPKMVDLWTLGQDADMAKTPEDVALISKGLDDSKNYPNLGITERLQWKDKLRSHANILYTEKKREESELRESVLKQAYVLEDNKRVSAGAKLNWIDDQVAKGTMHPGEARAMRHRIENPDGAKDVKTPDSVWADLDTRFSDLEHPEKWPTRQEIAKLRAEGRLSETDYRAFFNHRNTIENKQRTLTKAQDIHYNTEQNEIIKELKVQLAAQYPKDIVLQRAIISRVRQHVNNFDAGGNVNKLRQEAEEFASSIMLRTQESGTTKMRTELQRQLRENEFAEPGLKTYANPPKKGQVAKPEKVSASSTPKELPKAEEEKFQSWYKGWADKTGMNKNPDDENHKYDYRAAYKAGVVPPEKGGHWPSEYKALDHPNRVIKGVDTATGKPATYEVLWSQVSAKGSESKGKEWLMSQGWSEKQAEDIIRQGLAQRKIK